MYMGHLAVGLGARRFAPAPPLAALAAATIAPDLGDAVLGVAGMHHSWHVTHTAPAAACWAIAVGLVGAIAYGRRDALVLAALAATHVPLDYLTSRLGVLPSGPIVGLGLYATPAADLALEGVVIVAGWWLYRGTLDPARRTRWPVIAMLVVLLAFQATWDAIV